MNSFLIDADLFNLPEANTQVTRSGCGITGTTSIVVGSGYTNGTYPLGISGGGGSGCTITVVPDRRNLPEQLWTALTDAPPRNLQSLNAQPHWVNNAQLHWANKVKDVRAEWDAVAARDPAFRQMYASLANFSARRFGCKSECLVRTFHIAAAAGHIRPLARGTLPAPALAVSGDARYGRPPMIVSSLCDWAGFTVVDGTLRSAVRGLFPAGVGELVVLATLRQMGVVPEGWHTSVRAWPWEAAWAGEVAFVLRPQPQRLHRSVVLAAPVARALADHGSGGPSPPSHRPLRRLGLKN